MKAYVDGTEVSLSDPAIHITEGADRMYVRTPEGTFTAVAIKQGDKTFVSYKGRQYVVETKLNRTRSVSGSSSGELMAPMPGVIVDVLVEEGQEVKKGAKVLVLEAMKTQQPLLAPFDGTVRGLKAQKGEQVVENAVLAVIAPTTTS